jgi:transcriptional regulator with XRE-family HTH domain
MRHGPTARHVLGEGNGNVIEEIGAELRRLRKAQGLTLDQVARLSGLSTGFISQAERGLSTLSIKALQDLSQALGVHIGWFFQSDASPSGGERDMVVRLARRRRINYGNLGIVDHLLSPSLSGKLELLLCHFAPGASSGEEPYAHEGEEAGLVLKGRIEMWVAERHFILEEGDSFGFESTLPHRYRNPGRSESVVVWAITPPSY